MTKEGLLQLIAKTQPVEYEPVAKEGSTGTWPIALVLLLTDGLCVLLATLIAVLLLTVTSGAISPKTTEMVGCSVVLLLFCFYLSGLYPGIALNPVLELNRIVSGTTITFLLFLAAAFFLKDTLSYPRAMIMADWLLCMCFIVTGRTLTRSICSRFPWWGVRTVIIGTREQSQKMASTLDRHRHYGLRVVSSLAAPNLLMKSALEFRSGERTGNEAGSIPYAILHLSNIPAEHRAGIIDHCSQRFTRTLLIAEWPSLSSFGAKARDLGGTLGLELPHQLLSARAKLTKRLFDIVVSAILMVLIAPLWAIIAIAIKLTSKGPLYYAQSRIGHNSNLLRVWKFRTMVQNADSLLADYLRRHPELNAEWLRDHKLRRDPRITRAGRLLRKFSLDELPQLWNILIGEMSLVGPRPITTEEIDRYGPRFHLYIRAVPGLTGLWQVSGRNDTSYQERVAYDEFYVRNWSLWMDLHILTLTVKTVLSADGAY